MRGPAFHRVADLAPSGARAVGCFDVGAPTCVLSSGSPRPRWAAAKAWNWSLSRVVSVSGQAVSTVRDIPHPTRPLERGLSGVGLEVLSVLGGMPGGRIVVRWPHRSRPNPEGPVLCTFYFCCEFVLKACPWR
jgi:hypothetical protein